jgi:acyl dehydratase
VRKYFEDFRPGEVIDCGRRTVTRDAIIAFAREYDPQPIHIDEAYAASTPFGGVIASGLHMLGICMRHAVDTFLKECVTLGSPGTERIRFPKPLKPGRSVRVTAKVLEMNLSKSKAGRGNVKFALELHDERDGLLSEWVTVTIFACRPRE